MAKSLTEIQRLVSLQALGKNLTLAVILDTLQHRGNDSYGCYGINQNHHDFETWWITSSGAASGIIDMWHCQWNLLKPFKNQTEETQRKVWELLTKE